MAEEAHPKPSAAESKRMDPHAQAEQYLQRGLDHYDRQEIAEALQAYQACVRADPSYALGHNNLGIVLIDLERYDEALAELYECVRCDPAYSEVYNNLGFVLRRANRNMDAASAYAHFLQLEPEVEDAERIKSWIEKVRQENGLNVIPPFALPNEPLEIRPAVVAEKAQPPAQPSQIKSPAAPEHVAPVPKAAPAISIQPPSQPAAEVKSQYSQCELCLRFFSDSELAQHEGKATCRSCLAIMGGPTSAEPVVSAAEAAPAPAAHASSQPATAKTEAPAPKVERTVVKKPMALFKQKPNRAKMVVPLAVMVAVVAAGAAIVFLSRSSDKKKAAVPSQPDKPAPPVKNPEKPAPQQPQMVFDGSKVTISGLPKTCLAPLAPWSWKPVIEGLGGLAEQGGSLKFSLGKDAPPGMKAETDGTVSWTPRFADWDALRKGLPCKTELHVQIFDAKNEELYSATKPLDLTVQFGYEFGAARELGLEAHEIPALAVADINHDRRSNLLIASGDYRKGQLRVYMQRPDNPLPVPTQLAAGARFSALYAGDLEGNQAVDLLAANWLTGEVILFRPGVPLFSPVASLKVGPGPVALAVNSAGGGEHPQIAVLLGLGKSLILTSLTADCVFTPPLKVPLEISGAPGFVFPWNSAEAGAGFLVITPLDEKPLQFVGCPKDGWKKEIVPVKAELNVSGLIAAAAVLNGPPGRPPRLVLSVDGAPCRLVICEEKDGKFVQLPQTVELPGPGVGLVACDFNGSGSDDLLVVGAEDSGFYFTVSDAEGTLAAGPRLSTPHMLGPAVVFRKTLDGPELLLVDTDRKAHLVTPLK
jgi:hypothetical protein